MADGEKMRDEPITYAGMTCGDIPFNHLTSADYIGKNQILGCPKVYVKKDVSYYFNNNGQLYMIENSCDKSDLKSFTKKHGEPTHKHKSWDEDYENFSLDWDGRNSYIIFKTTKMKIGNRTIDSCSFSYHCKKVESSDREDCNPQEVLTQKNNVDQFIKALGIEFNDNAPEINEKTYAPYIENISNNVQSLGLPKPNEIKVLQRHVPGDQICMIYSTSDSVSVKQVIFDTVGDIAFNLANMTLIGNTSSIHYNISYHINKDKKPIKFSLCFSGTTDQ
jgi:hypothetical protein